MDLIREHLIYSNVPVTICFGILNQQEQYDCIRLLLATRTKDVKICKHTNTNKYIDKLLSIIDATIINCNSKENLPSSPSLFSSGFVLNH
jgi:hypothetical protein